MPGHSQGVEGPEWEAMYHHNRELSGESKKSSENKKGKSVVGHERSQRQKRVDHYDKNHQK